MKHLFVSLVPVFAVFLLKAHCFDKQEKFFIVRFLELATIAAFSLCVAFGPFLLQDDGIEQMNQIFRRLFPFGRGLVHAYWAPNIWAIYCFLDKILHLVNAYFIF